MTLLQMPAHIKTDLVNAMAKGPAFWTPRTCISKTETKISSLRSKEKHMLEKGGHKAPMVHAICMCARVYECVCVISS